MVKKNIPNLFTSLNFFCGCLGAYLAFKNLFEAAFFMVLLGAFFDLFRSPQNDNAVWPSEGSW